MLKRILAIALLLFVGCADAQTYPVQNLNVMGQLQLNGSPGTAGYYVQSNGSGNPTWAKSSGSFAGTSGLGIGTNTTLTTAQLGGWGQFQTNAGVVATMPALASSPLGATFTFIGGSVGGIVQGNGSDPIINAGNVSANTLTVMPGQAITLTSNSANWFVTSFGNGVQYSFADPGPAWTSLSTIYDSSRVSVNGCPKTAEFGANTVGTVNGLSGCVSIPSNSPAEVNMGAGVAGAAITQSTNTNAVGIFGQGTMNTGSSVGNAWGGNVLVANCPLPTCGTNTGLNLGNAYGFEIDMNTAKTSTGGTPGGNFIGLLVTGELNTAPGSDFSAMEVRDVGTTPWANGLKFATGCCTYGVLNSPAASGNSQPSYDTIYQATNSSGATEQGVQFLDAFGNMQFTPGVGGIISLNNSSQASKFQVGGTNVVSLSPFQPTYPGGIVGNTTGSGPSGGSIGEHEGNSGSGVSMTSGQTANCTSISLTAGDWDVWGTATFSPTSTITILYSGINTSAGTLPSAQGYQELATAFSSASGQVLATPVVQVNTSTSTTVYLTAQATFSGSVTCGGFIQARRRD